MCASIGRIKKGLRNPLQALRYVVTPVVRNSTVALTSRTTWGTNIFERNWDVCVILDTCRVDGLKTVASEYRFIQSVDEIWSVGGSSAEWMVHTFDREWNEVLTDTAYLTSNAWAQKIIDDQLKPNECSSDNLLRLRRFGDYDPIQQDGLGLLEHVWTYVSQGDRICEQHGVPDELIAGGTPPRYVTDRAIDVVRSGHYNRVILHYTQPHRPYLSRGFSESRELYRYETKPFEYLRNGGDRQTVWESYLDDLRWVLDDIEILLQNIDAERVVISADHGEAFGEYGIYGHSSGSIHPYVRRVPWVVTTATNTESYSPKITPSKETGVSANENLEALGYI
jgi:hypothetical protein